uniref:Uncharacterized protein n=1 Tax=Varanus komodoensis TaxID=61221 RepID=A0A8D2JBF2_VARKO
RGSWPSPWRVGLSLSGKSHLPLPPPPPPLLPGPREGSERAADQLSIVATTLQARELRLGQPCHDREPPRSRSVGSFPLTTLKEGDKVRACAKERERLWQPSTARCRPDTPPSEICHMSFTLKGSQYHLKECKVVLCLWKHLKKLVAF